MNELINQKLPDGPQIGFGYFRLVVDDHDEARDYVLLDVNSVLQEFINLPREEIIGKRASEVFRGKNRSGFNWFSFYRAVMRTGKTQETIQWIEPFGRQFHVTVIPLAGLMFSVVLREQLTPSTSTEQSPFALYLGEWFDAVSEQTHDAMLLVECCDGQFRYVCNNAIHKKNSGLSNIEGMSPIDCVGPKIGNKLIQYYEQCLSTGLPVVYEQRYHFSPGKRVWHTKISPITGVDGKQYLLSSSNDITELKTAQGENEALTHRLHSMFYQHAAIMLVVEPVTGEIVAANPAASAFYGYSKEELLRLNITDINVLPPQELAHHRTMAYEKKEQYFLFPHRLKSGEVRIVDVYSCPIPEGNRELLYSIIFDVTDRENYLSELYRQKEEFRTTLQSIGDGVVTTDRAGIITSLNAVAEELTGWKSSEAVGMLFSEVFLLQNEETFCPVENPIQKVLDTGRTVGLANHTVLINRCQKAVPIADSAAPIQGEDHQIMGVVMVFRDVSAEKEHHDQIRYISYHDSLTGLYNRCYIEKTISYLDDSSNLPLAVIMGDVNGLKITNDVFGHETGDALLRHMAASLTKNCRKNDVIARWGGDEVVLFLPHTTLAAAEAIIERIQSDSIDVCDSGLRMSISFGCAVKESARQCIQDVMRQAEEHMYRQKLLEGKSYRNAIINTLLATLYEKAVSQRNIPCACRPIATQSAESLGFPQRSSTSFHCLPFYMI